MSYDNPWTFNDQVFESEDIKKYYGFVYVIVDTLNDKKYIGRKYFWKHRKKKGASRRTKSESDWKKYYGSNDNLINNIKENGHKYYKRIILSLHKTKGDVNMFEVKEQWQRNVLEDDSYYNDNINGKWFKKADHIIEGRSISNVTDI